ncbi:MAG: peptide chain release factor N(5)-glutamine methyltransferase [Bacteroidales bacterium]|nr:MAG: peptide chain release factor N(5)-glutamine methyltransferase [Bacteroidales bacterium]
MNNSKKTVSNIVSKIKINLRDSYPDYEIQNFIYLIFEYLLNYTKIDIHNNGNKIISKKVEFQINKIINDLKKNKPIQYIFKKTEFYGLTFKVSPDTLIPRQETEELVAWIIKENIKKKCSILDIGTGCGCIAIVLARNLTSSTIEAIDISKKAINIAKTNARIHRASIKFFQYDILKYETKKLKNKYDIIVSNPPYIRESEKSAMPGNVLYYEPHKALFVPDDDPLIFYRAIAKFGLYNLKDKGILYLEINEALAQQVTEELAKHKYEKIKIGKDIRGKDRIVKACKA